MLMGDIWSMVYSHTGTTSLSYVQYNLVMLLLPSAPP